MNLQKRSLKEILAERKAKAQLEERDQSTSAPTNPRILGIGQRPDTLTASEVIAQIAEIQAKEQEQNQAPLQPAASETFALHIQLNERQLLAKDLAFQGKSFCLIGAAGTGKTTAQREIARSLLHQDQLSTHSFKIQGANGQRWTGPSIAFVAYTRIATGNLRRAIHKDPALEERLLHNVTTIHNLLEYEPEVYWNYETDRENFRFVPRRTAQNPLDITHLIIEEASMVGLDLWEKLLAALRPGVQIIFIGDINQLPPVFGPSILNYALVQLPVVELNQVYRQKGDSSILGNAHKILAGKSDLTFDSSTKLLEGGKVQQGQHKLAIALGQAIPKWISQGSYDPTQDIFLSPWNKQTLGTDNLNKIIAQELGSQRQAVVWEIVAGIAKLYLAIGDKILFNKQVGEVISIVRNGKYTGKTPQQESIHLTRFGTYAQATVQDEEEEDDFELAGYENISLEELMEEKDEKKRSASHLVTLKMENDSLEVLEAVGDFSPAAFSLSYALTVHKAQGCEWRKVFFILHKDHTISAYRELLYTASTRAREELNLIMKQSMLDKAISVQRIKGNTLEQKIEYFNAGLLGQENVQCTK